nr:hypothetical protein [Brucella anthropi]DAM62848.1 MAG TPA: holin [Caudoviricetes sp.]
MSNPILDTILQSATRTGSNIIKDIVTAQLGPTVGGLAGSVIDVVAGRLGVDTSEIPALPSETVDEAVISANRDPELLSLYIEQQKRTNELFLAEMNKSGDAWWTWAWRPFWMWLLAFMWVWNGIITPLVNGILASNILQIPWEALGAITATYTAMYLGGHTVKDFALKRWGK